MSEDLKTKRRRKYTAESLKDAICAVADGMSVRKASVTFRVPQMTIVRYEKSPTAQKIGRKTKLDTTEEALLVDMLIAFGNSGFPMNKHDLRSFADEMGFGKGIGTVFSEKWHRRFMRDHEKLISLRMGSNVDRKKAREWTPECAEDWISLLAKLESEGYLSDPAAIVNFDESGFMLGFEKEKVYAARGMKHVPSYTDGTTRDAVSTLFCGDAAGKMYKPLVLFDGIMHLKSMFDNTDGKLYIAVNASGVMDCDVITDYFRKVILPNAPQKCVILCDGHYSHVNNAQLFKLCRDSGKDIKLICLPAGQTDKLQPLDNCTFGCMKVKWTNYKASKRLDPSFEMTRNSFAGHLALLCTPEASRFSFDFEAPLKSGFKNTGIFPFSPETIRATVDKKLTAQDAPSLPVLTKESSPMKDVAEILRSRVPGDDDKINASIESIVSIYSGHKSVAQTVVAAAGKAFSFSKPKKQKKPKDQRLALERGRNVLDTEYVAAIEERNRARQALKDAKKSKASETADEVPKKRGRPKTVQIELPAAVKKRTRSKSAKADLPVASKKGRSKKVKNLYRSVVGQV